MSKRKKNDPNPEEEEDDDDDDNDSRSKQQQTAPQKIYDFHKKTIEFYPERLLDLNQQFAASITTQVKSEPYSVLVGNCLDYVRQYFNYEDDLLKYSPWLANRLKQSRSDIVKCLQETIDIYEALARHDFDRIFEKTSNTESSSSSPLSTGDTTTNKSTTSTIQIRPTPPPSQPPTTTTTSSSVPLFNFTKTTTASSSGGNDTAPITTGFNFKTPTTTTTASSSSSNSDTAPVTTGFTFKLPTTTANSTGSTDSAPMTTGFNFKMPTTTTSTAASPEKTNNIAPFSFSLPNTGFGTTRFSPTNFGNPIGSDKTSISTASSISFTPPKFSFTPTPTATTEQQGTTEDNEDEPSEPPEPEKVEHEADAKFTYRCRMGVKKGDKLIKRGPVQVNLKEISGKRQLTIRSDDTLGRLFLNILWSKLIELKKNSSKDLTFVCQLNPGMTEIKEGEFVVILLRFDSETERNDAYENLDKERT